MMRRRSKTPQAVIIAAVLSVVLLGALVWVLFFRGEIAWDVTNRKTYWNPFKPGTEYMLREDVFLTVYNDVRHQNTAQRSLDIGVPDTVAEYNSDPERWDGVREVVPAGSRFVISKITAQDMMTHEQVRMIGELVTPDGQRFESIQLSHLRERPEVIDAVGESSR